MSTDRLDIFIEDSLSYKVSPPKGTRFGIIELYFNKLFQNRDWQHMIDHPPSKLVVYKTMEKSGIIDNIIQHESWMSFSDVTTGRANNDFVNFGITNPDTDIITYWKVEHESPWYSKRLDKYILFIVKNENVINHDG